MKKAFLDLGTQPITNAYLPKPDVRDEYFYNLRVGLDESTSLVSLMETVDPPRMFNDTYAHRASMSRTMQSAASELARSIKETFSPEKVLEIGSNDGVFIRNFETSQVVGVEPCANLAKLTEAMGYKTYPWFWNVANAGAILEQHGPVDFVYSANTISHIEGLSEALEGVRLVLKNTGVFVLEDPSLYAVLRSNAYDQFYDEHVYVFSVLALRNILRENGLEIFRVENLSTHGGSNRVFIKKASNKAIDTDPSVEANIQREVALGMERIEAYEQFADRVESSKRKLVALLSELRERGKKIISYGATYKSTTVFNYCRLGRDIIEYITDTTPTKQGRFSPGMHIPIISPDVGFDDSVDYAFLGAWNFRDEIMDRENEYLKRGGKFVTHVPEAQVLQWLEPEV